MAFNRHWVAVTGGWIAPTSARPRFARRAEASRIHQRVGADTIGKGQSWRVAGSALDGFAVFGPPTRTASASAEAVRVGDLKAAQRRQIERATKTVSEAVRLIARAGPEGGEAVDGPGRHRRASSSSGASILHERAAKSSL